MKHHEKHPAPTPHHGPAAEPQGASRAAAADAGRSPQAPAQRQVAHASERDPANGADRGLADLVRGSPRMAAQRMQLQQFAGQSASPGMATTPWRAPPLSGTMPVQGVFWQWRGNQWHMTPSGQSSSSTTAAPQRKGAYDGEWMDDRVYEQRADPTLAPFIRQGETFVGEKAYDKQQANTSPHATDVRASAVQSPGMLYGSGLHEVVPTSIAGEVAGSGIPSLMGAQSGFRTSTSRQMFLQDDGDVGGHTGWARKPNSSRGSTHTKGQAAAHDQLRDEARGIMADKERRPDVVANRLLLAHLKVTPHGQDILEAEYLEGALPNLHRGLGSIGPVTPSGATPNPARLAAAQEEHRGRERVKRRGRAAKRRHQRGVSPSPPRSDIDGQGMGGAAVHNPTLEQQIEPMPEFDVGDDGNYAANLTAWISQPQREG